MSIEREKQNGITIAATFTAELLEEPLRFWMAQLGRRCAIHFAPYNNVIQSLLDPASVMSLNDEGLNVTLLRLEDWWRGATECEDATARERIQQRVAGFVDDLLSALISAAKGTSVPHLLCLCPASADLRRDPDAALFLEQMEARMVGALSSVPGAYAVSSREMLALYPVACCDDVHSDRLGHVPYTQALFDVMATMIARRYYRFANPLPAKVIVVDCDNTLWRGSCGEDGHLGVTVDAACRHLQEFLISQHKAGVLLALCSKNNESDVWSVFDDNPGMLLQRKHVVASRINWHHKSENIRAIADELNLGLDGFVFFDDSAIECAEVQARCPQVLTLQLPAAAEEVEKLLSHVWTLDHLKSTAEDSRRGESYASEIQRRQLLNESISLESFLAGLKLEIDIAPMSAADLPRVAQLAQRTNQFNFTGIRFTEAELGHRWGAGEIECAVLNLRDRFGDYGLVGAVLFADRDGRLEVDNVLMSCRALGRRAEHHLLCWLDDLVERRGLQGTRIHFTVTPRNRPALEFLGSLGAITRDGQAEFAPGELAARCRAAISGADTPRGPAAGHPERTVPAAIGQEADTNRLIRHIATRLADPTSISKAIAAWRPSQQRGDDGYIAPRTAIERALAEMWSTLLRIDKVGAEDNFFALGGQSLVAMQIVSRIHDSFGLEFSLWDFLSAKNLSEQAHRIETLLLEQAQEDDLDALLADLEKLGDDMPELQPAYSSRKRA